MPIGLSPNCRVWARKDAVVGGSEWVLATVAGGADMVNGKDTVQVLLPGTKRRKTLSSADVVPTTVQVVLEPLENVRPFKLSPANLLEGFGASHNICFVYQ